MNFAAVFQRFLNQFTQLEWKGGRKAVVKMMWALPWNPTFWNRPHISVNAPNVRELWCCACWINHVLKKQGFRVNVSLTSDKGRFLKKIPLDFDFIWNKSYKIVAISILANTSSMEDALLDKTKFLLTWSFSLSSNWLWPWVCTWQKIWLHEKEV